MAGIVLVQKFIQPGGAAYKGYVDYSGSVVKTKI